MFKPYSISFKILKTNKVQTRYFSELEFLEVFKQRFINEYKFRKEYAVSKIEMVIKYHKDAAFDYEILSVDTIGGESL
jgi:hypothetical protein